MSRDKAMIIVAATTGVCAAVLLVAASGPIWLRVLFGIPFILLLPGHATLLFVDPDGRLGSLELAAWSVGISISISALVGMGLAASLGLTAGTMIVSLALVTLLALVAAHRRAAGALDRPAALTRRNPVWRMVFGTIALLTCTLAVLLISAPNHNAPPRGHTVQLWGLPDSSGGGLRIGADNIDAPSKRYSLTIEQGGRLISQQSFDMPAGSHRLFEVKSSATWTRSAPVSAVLADVDGALPPRTISVWPTE